MVRNENAERADSGKLGPLSGVSKGIHPMMEEEVDVPSNGPLVNCWECADHGGCEGESGWSREHPIRCNSFVKNDLESRLDKAVEDNAKEAK